MNNSNQSSQKNYTYKPSEGKYVHVSRRVIMQIFINKGDRTQFTTLMNFVKDMVMLIIMLRDFIKAKIDAMLLFWSKCQAYCLLQIAKGLVCFLGDRLR